jgi:hypothetical protein
VELILVFLKVIFLFGFFVLSSGIIFGAERLAFASHDEQQLCRCRMRSENKFRISHGIQVVDYKDWELGWDQFVRNKPTHLTTEQWLGIAMKMSPSWHLLTPNAWPYRWKYLIVRPIFEAVIQNNLEFIDQSIVDKSFFFCDPKNILNSAVFSGNVDLAERIIIALKDHYGDDYESWDRTKFVKCEPVNVASSEEMVDLLSRHELLRDVNHIGKKDQQPLHSASSNLITSVVERYLELGAETKVVDKAEEIPFHKAISGFFRNLIMNQQDKHVAAFDIMRMFIDKDGPEFYIEQKVMEYAVSSKNKFLSLACSKSKTVEDWQMFAVDAFLQGMENILYPRPHTLTTDCMPRQPVQQETATLDQELEMFGSEWSEFSEELDPCNIDSSGISRLEQYLVYQ